MRIAVVTQYFPNSHQPWAGHSAYQTLRHLARSHEVMVFYPEASYPTHLTPPSAKRPALDLGWTPTDVKVRYILYPTLPVISRPLNGHVIARHLLPHVAGFEPDIILNYVVYPDGYAAVKIGRELNVPVVLTAIGSDLNRIPDPLCHNLTCVTLRNADHVTTVSRDLQTTARKMTKENHPVTTILNGCDTKIFHPQNRTEARRSLSIPEGEVILYVGRLDLRKGLCELVEATARLSKQRPRLHCYIVGAGPDKGRIQAAIEAQDAQKTITLVPSTQTGNVARWMAAADVVTLPSYREGCPNVILEALASGRPVVATNVGGIPELMDDSCGYLVPPMDVAALEDALDKTLSRPWNSYMIAAKHNRNWQDVARDLNALLERTYRKSNQSKRLLVSMAS